jgi:ABC-2 type transport system ATP-binding protein
MENLSYAAYLYGLNSRQARARTLEILARLGLEAKAIDKPVEELSRGMQQKVAIARALLTRPTVLLLDEPTTGLDPRSKREVQALVRELREQDSTTILLTTHDMTEAEELCDRIAIMEGGRIVALGTPAGLRRLVEPPDDRPASLEDVFLELTGKQLAAEQVEV